MSVFSDFITSIISGLPWGEVYPGKPAPPPPADDGRTASLRILARFISELTFYRESKPGSPPIPFRIPLEKIHIEWPDDADLIGQNPPVVALISGGDIDYQFVGMGSWIDEFTRDVHGKNTVLQVQAENVEPIWIDVICATKQERRAIREGLVQALSPTEFMAGIRFRVPDFYNQTVLFMLEKATINEGEDSVKNRRTLRMTTSMHYLDVALINVEPMTVVTTLYVDTEDGVEPLDLEDNEPDRVALEASEGEHPGPDRDYP